MNNNTVGFLLSIILCLLTMWLLLQPLPSAAEDIVRENQITTKNRGATHGWVYNTKKKILKFCLQTTGDRYDGGAEVVCIPYPKKVKLIEEHESVFLDNNIKYKVPNYRIGR